jgi:hypothetical protein
MYNAYSKFTKNGSRGQALAEYMPTLTTMGVFSIVVLWALGGLLADTFSGVNKCISEATSHNLSAECGGGNYQASGSSGQNSNSGSGGGTSALVFWTINPENSSTSSSNSSPSNSNTGGDQPPADQPPADQPPADQPPADQPPADQPPADQPPAERGPLTNFPADNGTTTMRVDVASNTYTTVTLTGPAAGVYEGWCVDYHNHISTGKKYNSGIAGENYSVVGHPENMDLVNWIINQDFQSQGYKMMDVQGAIWFLVDDNVSSKYTGGKAAKIVELAQANGEGFVPAVGQIVGLIIDPNDGAQEQMIQYPVTN